MKIKGHDGRIYSWSLVHLLVRPGACGCVYTEKAKCLVCKARLWIGRPEARPGGDRGGTSSDGDTDAEFSHEDPLSWPWLVPQISSVLCVWVQRAPKPDRVKRRP
jgi:hypothetical protein